MTPRFRVTGLNEHGLLRAPGHGRPSLVLAGHGATGRLSQQTAVGGGRDGGGGVRGPWGGSSFCPEARQAGVTGALSLEWGCGPEGPCDLSAVTRLGAVASCLNPGPRGVGFGVRGFSHAVTRAGRPGCPGPCDAGCGAGKTWVLCLVATVPPSPGHPSGGQTACPGDPRSDQVL